MARLFTTKLTAVERVDDRQLYGLAIVQEVAAETLSLLWLHMRATPRNDRFNCHFQVDLG